MAPHFLRTMKHTSDKEKLAAFKRQKRLEMRAVIRAFNVFRSGSAQAPGYSWPRAEEISRQLDEWNADIKRNTGWHLL